MSLPSSNTQWVDFFNDTHGLDFHFEDEAIFFASQLNDKDVSMPEQPTNTDNETIQSQLTGGNDGPQSPIASPQSTPQARLHPPIQPLLPTVPPQTTPTQPHEPWDMLRPSTTRESAPKRWDMLRPTPSTPKSEPQSRQSVLSAQKSADSKMPNWLAKHTWDELDWVRDGDHLAFRKNETGAWVRKRAARILTSPTQASRVHRPGGQHARQQRRRRVTDGCMRPLSLLHRRSSAAVPVQSHNTSLRSAMTDTEMGNDDCAPNEDQLRGDAEYDILPISDMIV